MKDRKLFVKINNQVKKIEYFSLTELTKDCAITSLDLLISHLFGALKSFPLYLNVYQILAYPFVINF